MYELMVSYDCGVSYAPDRQAETLEALGDRMRELDEQALRWYVTRDGEEIFAVACKIHRDLLAFIGTLRASRRAAPDARTLVDTPGDYVTTTIGE